MPQSKRHKRERKGRKKWNKSIVFFSLFSFLQPPFLLVILCTTQNTAVWKQIKHKQNFMYKHNKLFAYTQIYLSSIIIVYKQASVSHTHTRLTRHKIIFYIWWRFQLFRRLLSKRFIYSVSRLSFASTKLFRVDNRRRKRRKKTFRTTGKSSSTYFRPNPIRRFFRVCHFPKTDHTSALQECDIQFLFKIIDRKLSQQNFVFISLITDFVMHVYEGHNIK